MEITEVRVRLVNNRNDRLKAFCSMTFDNDFVVRDVKVIEGMGRYFVAMPSRKMSDRCSKCGGKNHLRARFCNSCGDLLPENRVKKSTAGKTRLHVDVAHPINGKCRHRIQELVILAFQEEVERSRQPGYIPVDMDEPDEDIPEAIR